MDSKGIKNLIFMPSCSPKEDTTETSGRWVGMDVVKKNIEKFKGTIDIEEEILEGTSFLISLPHFEKKA